MVYYDVIIIHRSSLNTDTDVCGAVICKILGRNVIWNDVTIRSFQYEVSCAFVCPPTVQVAVVTRVYTDLTLINLSVTYL